MSKDKPSTSWFRANYVDAQQIAAHFHMGEPDYDEIGERIWTAIQGWPKKELIGLVSWLMDQEYNARLKGERFSAVSRLEGHARNRAADDRRRAIREASGA